ncbi:hypothetical protein SAMN02746066_04105 [Anaerosporobacter mobilis DSM 15930]|jgi:hypothetical protein|uniref:DUF1540 domain-containing protein n=1 Tax=Anaerosporobacter mobilis DSM 15930 TaxID=1120996 RepID=A0A1M7MY27_9FIRM|nr:hypothetical protein [Anaerosporobacter mobilis]SHM95998.1 hypothetical protein SAMN02746066_04105 [Anaerosporobacter mobilis DSM 15930]
MLQIVFCNDDTCKHNKNGTCTAKTLIHDVQSIESRNEIFVKCVTYEDLRCEDDTR